MIKDESERWMREAACRGLTHLFFIDDARDVEEDPSILETRMPTEDYAEAKAICARCPVQSQCEALGLRATRLMGVWGGKDEAERTRIARQRRMT